MSFGGDPPAGSWQCCHLPGSDGFGVAPAPWPPLFRRGLGVAWLRPMLRRGRRQSGTGLDANRTSAFGLEEEQPQGSSPLTLGWERENTVRTRRKILPLWRAQKFSDWDTNPRVGKGKTENWDLACYKVLYINYNPLLQKKKVSEGQKNELLKKNLCICHSFHNCWC